MLYDIKSYLNAYIEKAAVDYCIPKLWITRSFGTQKRSNVVETAQDNKAINDYLETADGYRAFVNPYRYYSEMINLILKNEEKTERKKKSRDWLRNSAIYLMDLKDALRYNHKGYGAVNRPAGKYQEDGTFLKAIAVLPYLKVTGVDTICLSGLSENISDYSDRILSEFSPEEQFRGFLEAMDLLGLNLMIEMDLMTFSESDFWDFLEKRFITFSELYSCDGVLLKLNRQLDLSPIARIIGEIKGFNQYFSFACKLEELKESKSFKKLGFQAQFPKRSYLKEEDAVSLFRNRMEEQHIPVILEQKNDGDEEMDDRSKMNFLLSVFSPYTIPCIHQGYEFGNPERKGNWDYYEVEFRRFVQKILGFKAKYRKWVVQENLVENALTDTKGVLGYVYRSIENDSALVVLANTDKRRERWITLDIESIGMLHTSRVKRKLNNYREVREYLEMEECYIHVRLDPYEATLITLR